MKVKWGKKTYTVMFIPDANSPVLRFRVSNVILRISLILALAITCITLVIYFNGIQNSRTKAKLQTELTYKADQFEQTVEGKNRTIEQLQNDIIQLSQQTNEMKAKVEELKKLEKDIRSITKIDQPKSSKKVSIASTAQQNQYGVGGSSEPLDDNDIQQLVASTEQNLSSLSGEMKNLVGSLTNAKQRALKQQYLIRVTPTLWPTISNKISSEFGYRKDPFTNRPSFHDGLDIAGSYNDPVFVTADGTVRITGYDRSKGNHIIVKHANGLSTGYLHLNKILVEEGDTVSKGETIGLMGSTGRSTGPHVHYEVIKNGTIIDPLPYMPTTREDGQ